MNVYAHSKVYEGETHLVMDFDLYLKDDRLAINIVNGKKRSEFQHTNAIAEIGEFVMKMRLRYKNCLLRIAYLLLIMVSIVMMSIPWLVCSGLITGKERVDNKNFNIEIYLIVGVSMISGIVFVIVAFCWRKWLHKIRKKSFIKKMENYMNKTLSVRYSDYAYSIIYPKNNDNLWCQLRISDHVIKCRADDHVLHTTYNEITSSSIRNRSMGNAYSPVKSPLLQ